MRSNFNYQNGWITPEGQFLGCEEGGHFNLQNLHNLNEFECLKVSSYGGGFFYIVKEPTQAQIDSLFYWCQFYNKLELFNDFMEKHQITV